MEHDTKADRHHWGPAPSGEAQHRAVCRRCGLEEYTTWCSEADGHPVEVVAWVDPHGRLLAARPLQTREVPSRVGPLPTRQERVDLAPSRVEAVVHCPGTPRAWES